MIVWLLAACGPRLGLEPGDPLPERLSELDYERARDVYPYEPLWPLWSNGLDKQRYVYLPKGERIETGETWTWPLGSLLLKTFSWEGAPVETRGLYLTEDGWDYAVWLWDGEDATQLSLEESVPLDDVPHVVPSRFECRQCHEAGDGVLGFSAAQLVDPDELHHLFDETPAPEPIEGPDADTTQVLGYFYGNCVHCHNGRPGDEHSFDLRPDVALDNVVGVETDSSATAAGVRVVPGSPEESILYLAMSGEHDSDEIRDMPPVGVQVRDQDALTLLRRWIEAL